MSQIDALVEREKRKIKLLRDKIAQSEAHLQALMSMRSEDALDKLLDEELNAKPATDVAPKGWGPEVHDFKTRNKPIPSNWAALLKFIGTQGKTMPEVERFLNDEKIPISPPAARTGLMNYRKHYGFIENPKKGFYRLSANGLGVITSQKEENPEIWR